MEVVAEFLGLKLDQNVQFLQEFFFVNIEKSLIFILYCICRCHILAIYVYLIWKNYNLYYDFDSKS